MLKHARCLFILALSVCVGCVEPVRRLDALEHNAQESQVRRFLTMVVQALESGEEEDLKNAEATLILAYDVKPDDARIMDGFGCLELRRRRYDSAIAFFNRAIALSPEYDRPYEHLAQVAEERSDWKTAFELYELALNVNPLNNKARNNYAVLLKKHGSPRRAEEEIRKAKVNSAGQEEIVSQNFSLIQQTSAELVNR